MTAGTEETASGQIMELLLAFENWIDHLWLNESPQIPEKPTQREGFLFVYNVEGSGAT